MRCRCSLQASISDAQPFDSIRIATTGGNVVLDPHRCPINKFSEYPMSVVIPIAPKSDPPMAKPRSRLFSLYWPISQGSSTPIKIRVTAAIIGM